MMETVVIRTVLNSQGQVTDAEVSAASDRTLVDSALTAAKRFQLNGPNEAYLTVRFLARAE
jgi:TonB family protein